MPLRPLRPPFGPTKTTGWDIARRSAGFTMIELLVVITIIAILAGLLLPAIKLVRIQASGAACSNVMRQVVAGHFGYAHDNEDFLPFTFYSPDSTAAQKNGSWHYLIQSYTEMGDASTGTGGTSRTSKSVRCPSLPKEYLTSTLPQFDSGTAGLARNTQLRAASSTSLLMASPNDGISSATWVQFTLGTITEKTRRMLLGHADLGASIYIDSNGSAFGSLRPIDSIKPSQYNIWPAGTPTGTAGGQDRPSYISFFTIHGAGMPYAFLDGHVQKITGMAEAAKTIYNPAIFSQ